MEQKRRAALSCAGSAVALAAAATVLGPHAAPGTRFPPPDSAQALVRVIVQSNRPDLLEEAVRGLGGQVRHNLRHAGALVAELPGQAVAVLAANPRVQAIHPDRPLRATLHRTTATIGADWVARHLGFDGTGIGVAIIDSGVASGHEDLATRIVHFADFVDTDTRQRDGYGHGTHVAGIIAGSGRSSGGRRRGVAPGSHLVVLRALDERGDGAISNAIAALDYAIEQRAAFNIRVINLSVAAGVYESYRTDPLTLAARRAVEAGMVVVTAGGNLGRDADGRVQYGGITSPGNAPWVLTVGASTHNGTVDPSDDEVAPFSSLGPSALDFVAKPDVVAPGVGIESTADPAGTLFLARPQVRTWETIPAGAEPYLSLSGTSMAAPVAAGAVALVLQANPALTPAAAKAVVTGTADFHEGQSEFAQGAGFLNARRAVQLARTLAESPAATALLEGLVAAGEPDDGVWPAPCRPAEPECRYLVAACAGIPCFGYPDGAPARGITGAGKATAWPGDVE